MTDFDRHRLWRIVKRNLDAMEVEAPDGYEAVVEVFLAGRAEPLLLHEVQTSRDADFPWAFLLSSDDHSAPVHPSDRVTLTPEAYIQRVEIGYHRKGSAPLGFRVTDLPADDE